MFRVARVDVTVKTGNGRVTSTNTGWEKWKMKKKNREWSVKLVIGLTSKLFFFLFYVSRFPFPVPRFSDIRTRVFAVVRALPQCSNLWVECRWFSALLREVFFSVYSGFPSSSKIKTTKFQFDLKRTTRTLIWLLLIEPLRPSCLDKYHWQYVFAVSVSFSNRSPYTRTVVGDSVGNTCYSKVHPFYFCQRLLCVCTDLDKLKRLPGSLNLFFFFLILWIRSADKIY